MTVEHLDAYRSVPLSNDQLHRMTKGYCPDCSHRGFVFGPRGGASINVECGNIDCRSRFSVTQGLYSHAMVFGQRIPKAVGNDWGTPDAKE